MGGCDVGGKQVFHSGRIHSASKKDGVEGGSCWFEAGVSR